MRAAERDLFDPATKDAILREAAPVLLTTLGIVVPVMAVLLAVLHHEYPFLAYMTGACSRADYVYECARAPFDALAGVLGLVVFGGFGAALYRWRRMPPTITCEACGGTGWVLDLEPRGGRCPRCGHGLFTYRATTAHGNPNGPMLVRIVEHHRPGAELIARFHATRRSWMHRYY
jgi:hypothetical protein